MGPKVKKSKDGHAVGNLELASYKMKQIPHPCCVAIEELNVRCG